MGTDPSVSPPTRTPAQAAASRLSGARSVGPVTALGKTASGANAIVHGLPTRAALMPGEDVEQYRANLSAWNVTLGARTPEEAQVVGRIADVTVRLDRLARPEEKLTVATVEKAPVAVLRSMAPRAA